MDAEKASMESYVATFLDLDSGLNWASLRTNPLSVVLGEPGSGKSEEFEEQARSLAADGEFAFYIRLDQLVDETLDQILTPDERDRFNRWQASPDTAIFYLDSVDEAKLRRAIDFERALRRFQSSLGSGRLERAHVVISSRISEWRPVKDANTVLEILGSRAPKLQTVNENGEIAPREEKAPELTVVLLTPLDRPRVKRLVEHLGVANSERFLLALDRQHAWTFARRPIDVIGLVNYWQQHEELGSLSDLIEFDIRRTLRETEDRRNEDPLTEETAREGAETLAAAASLCRKLAFVVTDDGVVDDGGALDASASLSTNWTPRQQSALLARAIFDAESYGRIRFHHRQVLEYLTSSWFSRRMRLGCPLQALKDILFADESGSLVVRPSVAPVAAWLASGNDEWNRHVRQWVLQAAPWLHFQFGDPRSLPLRYKRQILQALVDRFGNRERVWIDLDAEALARLADEGLTDDVNRIVLDRQLAEDLRADMLSLVRFGRMVGCLDAAVDIVERPDESESLKSYAVVALRDVPELQQLQRLARVVEQVDRVGRSYCGHLCEALYPNVLDAQGVARLLRKADPVSRNAVDLEWYLERHLAETLTPARSEEMVVALISLCREEPHVRAGERTIPVSEQFKWMGEPLETTIVRLLQSRELSQNQVSLAVEAMWVLGDLDRANLGDRDKHEKLREVASTKSEIRRAYFWKLAERWRARNLGDPAGHYDIYGTRAVLRPERSDRTWLLADARQSTNESDKRIALLLLLDNLRQFGTPSDYLRVLLQLLARPETRGSYLAISVQDIRSSISRMWYRHFSTSSRERWWQHFARWCRRFGRHYSDQLYLLKKLRELSLGRNVRVLAALVREAREGQKNDRWVPDNWNGLVQRRGKLIARATIKGCLRAWRRFTPSLPHQRNNHLHTDQEVPVGLAGLDREFELNPEAANVLTEQDCRLAIRYSVNELNGFAPWTSKLARARPEQVRVQLLECIAGEWLIPEVAPHVHEVLARIVWHDEQLGMLVADDVLRKLAEGDPLNTSILEQSLSLIAKHLPDERRRVAEIARARTEQYEESSRGFFLWMTMWLQCNAQAAIEHLQARLAASPNPIDLMVGLTSELSGDRFGKAAMLPEPDFERPRVFSELISLVYQFVSVAEDVEHQGTYSPGPRDRAQQFRSSLLERLAASDGEEAEHALASLIDNPHLASHRDWIINLIERRRVRLADDAPWTATDIREFEREYEHDPRSETQLFEIARRRLLDIKENLETSDNSPRAEVHPDQHEVELRAWLARKLSERAKGRYVIPQEEEIERGNPDLRFHHPSTGPVSVEIKWTHRWSAAELLERLENQLVGQYMRATNAKCGFFVIGRIDPERGWNFEGRRLDLAGLVQLLQRKAAEIRAARADIHALEVISLDFVSA